MTVKRFLPLILSLAAGAFGCAPVGTPEAPTAGISAYTNLDEPTLRPTGLGLAGQGRILFNDPLNGISSREHFVLEFSDWKDEGFFILHSHLNSYQALDGIQVQARRHQDDIEFSLSTPGFPARQIFRLDGVLASADLIRLRLEIHDGGVDGVRLLIWQDSVSYQGELLSQLPLVSEVNALYDSKENKVIALSHGRGVRWGLQLMNIGLRKAYREVPYVH